LVSPFGTSSTSRFMLYVRCSDVSTLDFSKLSRDAGSHKGCRNFFFHPSLLTAFLAQYLIGSMYHPKVLQ
jgi:hypothetical protein